MTKTVQLLLSLLALCSSLNAEIIVAGFETAAPTTPFAALGEVGSTSVTSIDVSALPPTGIIQTADMNIDGFSLIGGGVSGGGAFGAHVTSSGSLSLLTGGPLPAVGTVDDVAINASGNGFIVGRDGGTLSGFAFSVSPTGVMSPLTGDPLPATGTVSDAAINPSGAGIIVGFGVASAPYGAVISPAGVATNFSGVAIAADVDIRDCDVSDSGLGLIGGYDSSDQCFLFQVSSTGVVSNVSGDPLSSDGGIESVAMNASGAGIFCGFDNAAGGYGGTVTSGGVVSVLTGLDTGGTFLDVCDINDSGEGIMGGQADSGDFYVVRVTSTGTVVNTSGVTLPNGQVQDVAISPEGVGIAGGDNFDNGEGYALLIAPNGAATELTGIPSGGIRGVGISGEGADESGGISNSVVPTSFGPANSYANQLFLLTHILESHYTKFHKSFNRGTSSNTEAPASTEVGLIASVGDNFLRFAPSECDTPNYSVWGAFFGDYIYQGTTDAIPAFSNKIAGALFGFDYKGLNSCVVGGGLSYLFDYVHYSRSLGHAQIHQETGVLYASLNQDLLFFNLSLWGGSYQLFNKRHAIAGITSNASLVGWLLSPHAELSFPYLINDCGGIDPFVMVDWANNWQEKTTESGSSGFNLEVPSQYTSLLRTEAGLRFYQIFENSWGRLVVQEKGSYVYKKPFDTGAVSTAFVGSVSTFSIETFSSTTQNLAVGQLSFNFIPMDPKYPYSSIDYQGEFGSSFQSHLLTWEIGVEF